MTRTEIRASLVEAIDHVRFESDDCDLCQMNADTAEKVLGCFPASWFGADLDIVYEVVEELRDY